MTHEQLKLLSQMKKLIKNGKCRFQVRNDRDYLEELLNLGISEREAWNYILTLNSNFYVHDFKPNYLINGESLIFKRLINGNIAYIKLKIEKSESDEETVCLSFHKDSSNKGEYVNEM